MSTLARTTVPTFLAVALLAGSATAASSSSAVGKCTAVAGNLIAGCAFDKDIAGWKASGDTALRFDSRRGHERPGALEMTNQPASEAGASLCVPVVGAGTYELSGALRRMVGNGDCLPFVEEHAAPDCGDGATAFHELESQPLRPNAFTRVTGTAVIGPRTLAIRAGFACYGEHDDDVSAVLVDDVVLRKLP